MKIILFFILILTPIISLANGVSRFCFQVGGINEPVCSISMSTLLARGEDFDGKIVVVTGFFAYSDIPMLFADKEAFLSSNVENGIAIVMPKNVRIGNKIYDLNHKDITLMGRYSMKPVDTTKYHGYRTGGRLYDITEVGGAFLPWGFSEYVKPYSPKGISPPPL